MASKVIKILVLIFTGLIAYFCWKRSAKTVNSEDNSINDEEGDNDSSSVSDSSNDLTIENLRNKLISDNRFDYNSCFTEEVSKFMGYVDVTNEGKICVSINHEEYEEPSITIADSVSYMWEVTHIIKESKGSDFNIHVSHTGTNRDGVAHKGFDKNLDREALTNIIVNKGSIDDVVDLLHILMYPKDLISLDSNGYYRSKKGKLIIPVEYFPLRLVNRS